MALTFSVIYDREGANWQNAMAYAARLTHEGIDDFSQDGVCYVLKAYTPNARY